jgi:hypothetical protein
MRTRNAPFSWFAVAVVSMLCSATPGAAQQPTGQVVKLGEGVTLTISGFINASFYWDRNLLGGFGQGQHA